MARRCPFVFLVVAVGTGLACSSSTPVQVKADASSEVCHLDDQGQCVRMRDSGTCTPIRAQRFDVKDRCVAGDETLACCYSSSGEVCGGFFEDVCAADPNGNLYRVHGVALEDYNSKFRACTNDERTQIEIGTKVPSCEP